MKALLEKEHKRMGVCILDEEQSTKYERNVNETKFRAACRETK